MIYRVSFSKEIWYESHTSLNDLEFREYNLRQGRADDRERILSWELKAR